MIVYDKDEIRQQISLENIYSLLEEWGGEPQYVPTGLISQSICHNPVGEGKYKLYYYSNTQLFQCYSNCGFFDIFQLCIKVMDLQHHLSFDLNDAVRWIAQKFGLAGRQENISEKDSLEDWKILANYSRIEEIKVATPNVILKEYDNTILNYFNYKIKLLPWLKEGISQKVLDKARIGFYPGGDQITIPHFDKDNRFIGLRGRTVVQEDAERYGKYRPITINGVMYNHPLGLNLYNLNNSKENIKKLKKAIVTEGEKSCLLYQTYFGFENDISVACCGSSLSAYQAQLLIDAGAQEIIIAFDRQFQNVGDDEFVHLVNNLKRIQMKYKNYVQVSYILDRKKITGYKDSPIDCGKEKFLILYKERI